MSTVDGVLVRGRYRLREEIGSGPHGRVWRAEDELLKRAVAVKELPAAGDDEIEAIRAASSVQHPSIVPVYNVVADHGQIWIVQGLVRGHSLAELVAGTGPLSVGSAERLAGQLLGALQTAHREGVLHRDIKPTNVIIDSSGVAVLTDFGLAPGPELVIDVLAGSPRYAPPERIISNRVGPEGDLFQLGATLYFALSGREPFVIEAGQAVASAYNVAMLPHAPLDQGLELATFVDGLLDKEPEHRLTTGAAQVMLASIGSTPLPSNFRVVLEGPPTDAGIDHTVERAAVLEYTPVAAGAWANPPVAQPGPIGPEDEAIAAPPRHRAVPKEPEIDDPDRFLWPVETMPAEWNVWTTEREPISWATGDQRPDEDGVPPARRNYLIGGLAAALVLIAITVVAVVVLRTESSSGPAAAAPTVRASATSEPTPTIQPTLTGRTLSGHASWVGAVAWSPDGRLVASGSADKSVRIWDPATGLTTMTLTGHTSFIDAVAWSADGALIASGGGDATVRIWDAHTGGLVRELKGHTGTVRAVAWSPDGRVLASASIDHTVRLWDPSTGMTLHKLGGHSDRVLALGWSPDGATLAAAGDGVVRLWDPLSGALIRGSSRLPATLRALAWSPDGRALATASEDGTVRIWDPATTMVTRELTGHKGQVWAVAWSPDGTRLASAGADKDVRLWDPRTGNAGDQLTGHTAAVTSVAFSPDGRYLVSGGNDKVVRVWVLNPS